MTNNITLYLSLLLIFLSTAMVCAQSAPEEGLTSYYSDALEGRSTASGEPYQKALFTAAHRTLPFNTKVRVTNLNNRKSVVVRINDRGPFVKGRIIDVSRAAAEALGIVKKGVVSVTIEVLKSD